jgi:hypothetical protein
MLKKSNALHSQVWVALFLFAALFLSGTAELVPIISTAPSFVADDIEMQVDLKTKMQLLLQETTKVKGNFS